MIFPDDIKLFDKYKIIQDKNLQKYIVLSTSADPLHAGHLNIIHYAEENFKEYTPVFEITQVNCDKGKLSNEEVLSRVEQFNKICRPVF